jgi:hypothetical protein
MKTKTREPDLELLDEARRKAKTELGKTHREALLVAIYEASKDDWLEKMRIQLIDALKYGDLRKMDEIRRKIQDYASTPSFRRRIAQKIAKISEREAEVYFDKTERR